MEPLTTEHRASLHPDPAANNVSNLPKLVEAVFSDDPERQLDAAKNIRRFLANDKNQPIERVVECNVVPRFVEFLRRSHSALRLQAAWALTEIASGTRNHKQAIVNANAVPALVRLLACPVCGLQEQAVWGICNIAGHGAQSRDCVLQHGALGPLLALLDEHHEPSMIRAVISTLRNLCSATYARPAWKLISPALPALARLIYAPDDTVLTDACWALARLPVNDGVIDDILEAGVCRRLVDLLAHPSAEVRAPALRSVANLVRGDDLQKQVVIACGVLPALGALLASPELAVRVKACRALANIAAGSSMQVQALLDARVVHALVGLLRDADARIRDAAHRAVLRAMHGGLWDLLPRDDRVAQGCVEVLCWELQAADSKAVRLALNGILNILHYGFCSETNSSGADMYGGYVEEAGGVNAIRKLQHHGDRGICETATSIIRDYFSSKDDTL